MLRYGLFIGAAVLALVIFAYYEIYLFAARFLRFDKRRQAIFVVALAVPVILAMARGWGDLDPYGYLRALGRFALVFHIAALTAAIPLLIIRLVGRALAKRVASSAPTVELVSPETEEPPPAAISRRELIERGLGAATLVATGAAYTVGVVTRLDFHVTEIPIRIARLPKALDGFSIVQISDIHVGPFVDERALRRGVDLVNGLRPDLAVVTGDIVDHDATYIGLAARMLGQLRARDGVFCISGNHDYYTGVEAVLAAMDAAGVKPLRNAGTLVGEGKIALLGVEDLWAARSRGGSPPNIEAAIGTTPRDVPRILLAHQPPFFDEPGVDVDLQLSGHTHGGQINPGFTPSKLVFPYVAGRYDAPGRVLYVNRGFGTAGPPCRLMAPAEVTKIILVAG